jgi:hypothetical protein
MMKLKLFSGSVVTDSTLTDRQIRVIANCGKPDRVKECFRQAGQC